MNNLVIALLFFLGGILSAHAYYTGAKVVLDGLEALGAGVMFLAVWLVVRHSYTRIKKEAQRHFV